MRCCHRPEVRIEQAPSVKPAVTLTGRPLCKFYFECCSRHPNKFKFLFYFIML